MVSRLWNLLLPLLMASEISSSLGCFLWLFFLCFLVLGKAFEDVDLLALDLEAVVLLLVEMVEDEELLDDFEVLELLGDLVVIDFGIDALLLLEDLFFLLLLEALVEMDLGIDFDLAVDVVLLSLLSPPSSSPSFSFSRAFKIFLAIDVSRIVS